MPALVRSLAVLGLLFAGTAALAPAVAQALAPAAAQETESAAAIQAHIDQVRNDTALSAELRASLLESYERWLQFAKVVEAQNALAGQFAARIAAAPAELAARQQEDPASGLPPVPPPAAKLSELEHALGDWRPALETAAGAADEAAREPVRRTQRRAQIQAKLVELRQRSDALPAQPADQVGDPRLLLARRGALQAERRALAAEQG